VLNQPGLSQCAVSLRTQLWEWAEPMDQKQYLCRGCYDPYCDADSKAAVAAMDCGIDTHSHDDDAESFSWDLAALLGSAQSGVVDNLNVLVMVAAAMTAAMRWTHAKAPIAAHRRIRGGLHNARTTQRRE